MPHNFETTSDEGVRQVFPVDDLYMKLDANLERYEDVRRDNIYDQHVSYARSIAKNIADGMDARQVVSIISVEIIHFNMDVLKTVELTNYFLEENERPERLDTLLNVLRPSGDVHSGITADVMQDYALSRVERDREACMHLAEAAIQHMMTPVIHPLALAFIKGDLMYDQLDNVLFAQCVNEKLEEMGASHRFNQYLEVIEQD